MTCSDLDTYCRFAERQGRFEVKPLLFMSGLSLSAFYKDPGCLLSNRYDSPENILYADCSELPLDLGFFLFVAQAEEAVKHKQTGNKARGTCPLATAAMNS